MAIIQEEINNNITDFGVTLLVVQHTQDEMYDPWHIICIDDLENRSMSPKELCKLGHWLVKQSKVIGSKYTSSGNLKINKEK